MRDYVTKFLSPLKNALKNAPYFPLMVFSRFFMFLNFLPAFVRLRNHAPNFFQQSQNDAPHPQTYSLIDDRFGALEKTVKTFNVTLGTGQNKEGAKTRIRARNFYLSTIFEILLIIVVSIKIMYKCR